MPFTKIALIWNRILDKMVFFPTGKMASETYQQQPDGSDSVVTKALRKLSSTSELSAPTAAATKKNSSSSQLVLTVEEPRVNGAPDSTVVDVTSLVCKQLIAEASKEASLFGSAGRLSPSGESINSMEFDAVSRCTQVTTLDGVGGGGIRGCGDGKDADASSIRISDYEEIAPHHRHNHDESACKMAAQSLPPYILAGVGMVVAGLLLDYVQDWDAFTKVREMYIVMPPLLGMKGNLEMTLASRLSTQANLGILNNKKATRRCVMGNLILTQCQASVLGLFSAIIAIILTMIKEGVSSYQNYMILFSCTLLVSAVTNVILGVITVVVVLGCRRYNINPDNVATPLAAALGDVSTLGLLAVIGNGLISIIDDSKYIGPAIIVVSVASIPIFLWMSYNNEYVREGVSIAGWIPIVAAMMIGTGGGYVLDIAVQKFKNLAMFQPVVNGVGGNLVAIQASRISTYLHRYSTPRHLPRTAPICLNPFSVFFGNRDPHASTARVLMAFVIPSHIVFAIVIVLIKTQAVRFTAAFSIAYILAVVLQVALLLMIARWMIYSIWKAGRDPDNEAIPYLTALGDLLGITFLASVFFLLTAMGFSTDIV